ncbi:aspartate beta-hydroxylase domain-containing protein 2-like [Dreissena polymorpha]|uniref:Aspartyl/asparaginy/proline hydroxylase domain-containing protein n=1 Tax=Dreissena polymorpha TaxID=45954 RepID=A0A9D4N9Y2_DREPO|nr:aspartate beta-hydroxylase domain-containing protein 2-like [Dreissena polymorpha]KAH3889894.1 hypothetical protein DPMN_013961 [Dreissena polymorpha]
MDGLTLISEYSFYIGLIIFALLFFLNKKCGFEVMTVPTRALSQSKRDDDDLNFCSDPNCVRCNKYSEVLCKAQHCLKDVSEKQIASDIKNGISRGKYDNEAQQPSTFHYKCQELISTPIWENFHGADTELLESALDDIKTECERVIASGDGHWKRNSTSSGEWDTFHLINQGTVIMENATLCPNTLKVVQNLPSVMDRNVFGNVFFSMIKPGTVIAEHFGPTNIRLRCHLGLSVNKECLLTVDDQTTSWSEGRCLVFDDSFLHSVAHFGIPDRPAPELCSSLLENRHSVSRTEKSSDRVVLIVDLWHPDITPKERSVIDFVFKP